MIASLGAVELAAVASIILVAACAQMVSGFGFALMAVPLMGLAIDLKTAVVISTICGTASNTFQAVRGSRHRDGRLVKVLVVSSFVGMPFGVILLDRVNVEVLQVAIGCVVLMALMAVVARPEGKAVGGAVLEITAGFASGVLATSTSTNGPPLVLLLRSRGLSPDRFRATINSVFSIVAVTTCRGLRVDGQIHRRCRDRIVGLLARAGDRYGAGFSTPRTAVGRCLLEDRARLVGCDCDELDRVGPDLTMGQ